ncbi:MAG TPA: hypothetical protein VFM64_03005 [Candidatus Nitrosotenuis sp.]|nr:hypothetical protein [Candidatus Nitrosotenuis sp.]
MMCLGQMFSKTEREYLNGKQTTRSYRYSLECRIRKKLLRFYRLELPLIMKNENLAEFCYDLAESSITSQLRSLQEAFNGNASGDTFRTY